MCDCLFFFKQKTAYDMRISDWSSDVCSSDLTEWLALYDQLWDRHGADPGDRLPRGHFDWLAGDPQAFAFVARLDGAVAAVSIWLADGEIAHNHLGASSDAGNRLGARLALYARAEERQAGKGCVSACWQCGSL